MDDWFRSLVVFAAQMGGYEVPADQPEILSVTVEWMSNRACPKHPANCPVLGLYDDKDVIYLRDDLTDTARDHVAVHEIVHWLQHRSHKFNLKSCIDIVDREREAYHVQNLYIWQVQNGLNAMHVPPMICPTEESP